MGIIEHSPRDSWGCQDLWDGESDDISISRVRYLIEDRDTGYIPEVTTCIWTAERSEGVHIQVVTEGI